MVEAIGIYKKYGRKRVLEGAGLKALPGTVTGIVGGNGCGKTTLLSILAGVVHMDGGSILYDGEEAAGKKSVFVRYVAYVPQENPIMEELSVRDNLRLWFKGGRRQMEEDLEVGTCAMLGMKDILSVRAGKLSGGMKKRLSIACALSGKAPALVLDEPGAALDLICKEEIRIYLKDYVKNGGTVIMASHELEELSMCDSMYVLRRGKLEEISAGLSAKELIARFR